MNKFQKQEDFSYPQTSQALAWDYANLTPLNQSVQTVGGDGLLFPMGTAGSDPAEAGAEAVSIVRAAAEAKGI